ncbi:sodium:solute symporter family transporter [Polyangium spumosum]|uniref:sodium:solute symporter family transporter n=1 Tax=Polyangium spumosum TaxID=889282 RepID=UPI001478084E
MLHTIDILIVLVFIAYSIWSGVGGAKEAGESLEEYFLAGRSLKGWQAGISMAATQFAADTPLVVTGLVATAGVFSLWRMWIYAIAFLVMALVLGASWRRSGVITDAALTETRYGGKPAAVLRGAKAVYFGLIFNCTVLGMVLLATTRITEPFLLWHRWLPAGLFESLSSAVQWFGFPLTASGAPCGAENLCDAGATCLKLRCIGEAEWAASTNNVLSIGSIVLVTTLYSTTGGLRAVVKTDIAQFGVAILSTMVYAALVISAVGGFGAISSGLSNLFPADRSGPAGMTAEELVAFTPGEAHGAGFTVVGVILIQWICQINADGSGYLAQRTMGCRSDKDAQSAGIVFTVTQVLFRSLFWLPIALGLLVLFPPSQGLSGAALASERESTFVRGIAELLPPGAKGLMLTGMLGALASTVDTHLNWGSSYFTNDIYRRFIAKHLLKREPSPRSLVWVARLSNLGILAVALLVMPHMDSIQTAWKASLLLGAGVGVVLVLRWIWWRMNATGELSALVASLVLAPILLFAVEDDGARLLVQAVVSTAVAVVAALVTKPEAEDRLREFYDRARPPGFWGPVSLEKGAADRRRLLVNLAAAGGSAFSIFCVLTGIGSWMIGSPPPAWLPSAPVWITLNLLVGVGTVPLWIKLARAGRLEEATDGAAGRSGEALPSASTHG